MQCKGAKSFVDDLGLSRGVVLSRAAASLRSIETKPLDWEICPLEKDTSLTKSLKACLIFCQISRMEVRLLINFNFLKQLLVRRFDSSPGQIYLTWPGGKVGRMTSGPTSTCLKKAK